MSGGLTHAGRAYAGHGMPIERWVADFVPAALGKQEPSRQDRFADHTAYREAAAKLTVTGKSGEQSTLHALAGCAGKPVTAMFVFGLDNSAATKKTPAKAAAPRKTARTFANMLPYCMETQCLSRREVPAQPSRLIPVESTCGRRGHDGSACERQHKRECRSGPQARTSRTRGKNSAVAGAEASARRRH